MLWSYVKVMLRSIKRHKGYAFINIAGLAIGMACCLLIMLWVMEELSFDRFHTNRDSIYRVEQDQFYSGDVYHVTVTPYPMGEGIKEEIPEIKEAARAAWMGTLLLKYEDKAFFEQSGRAVDPSFLTMLSFPLLQGDAATALSTPNSLVLTEELAVKYFGDEDPLGKVITVDNEHPFTVTGILKKIPDNSSLQFDLLVPFDILKANGRYNESWGSNSILTLVQLHDNVSVDEVNKKITDVRHNHVAEAISDDPEELQEFNQGQRTQFMLMPITDIYLHGYFGYGHPPGNILFVYIFTVIGLFLLLIACINFMNLATARSAKRAKEVGLRKVVGASKKDLIGQFYGESILMAFIALVFALGMVALLLPSFNTLAGKTMSLSAVFEGRFLLGMLAITLVTGLISGSYPALFLSSFHPARVLKGMLRTGGSSGLFRKILVVTQFTLSILLVIGTTVVYKQVKYMRGKSLGYDKEHVIYLPLRGDTRNSYELLKQELKRDTGILNVSGTNHSPTQIGSNSSGADWEGKDPELEVLISTNRVDYDYVETMKIGMVEGRTFSKEFSTDPTSAFLVNEEMVKIMGVESAVGRRFDFQGIDGTIIGIMKNFHFQSVRYAIEPLAFTVRPDRVNYAVIRLQAGKIQASIDFVRSTWEKVIPAFPFDYRFMDEDFDRMYRGDERVGFLLRSFTLIAVIIACLGLFGLALFMAEQRTKEIGVRKILGSSVGGIVILLSKEFAKWVLVANIIAWPVAYFIMSRWLRTFAYRTSLAWWVFLSAGLMALVAALLTVSYQSVKAALANPADSLRYE